MEIQRGWYDHHDIAWGDNRFGLSLIAKGFIHVRPETLPGILLATAVAAIVTMCISLLPQSGILEDGVDSLFTATNIGAMTIMAAMWPAIQEVWIKLSGMFTHLGRTMTKTNMPKAVAVELASLIMSESLIDSKHSKVAMAALDIEDAIDNLEKSHPQQKKAFDIAREIVNLRCISHQMYANPSITMTILIQCCVTLPLAYWAAMGWWVILLSFVFSIIFLSLYDAISTGQMVVAGCSSAVEYMEFRIIGLAD